MVVARKMKEPAAGATAAAGGCGPTEKGEPYDPFEHRNHNNSNSDLRSVANLIKSSLGSGLLAMPLAFSAAGWAVGLVCTIVISFLCGHCIHILVTTSRECCKLERQPSFGYAETCEAVFANGPMQLRKFSSIVRVFADLALSATYLAICCVYTILISDSLKQIFDNYFPDTILEVQLYCLMLLVPLSLISQVRSLKWLAPFSLTANVLLFLTFLICIYYIFSDVEQLAVRERKLAGDISRFPAFLSTVIFALEGVGVVMPTENSMAKPQHFLGCPSVLVVAMLIITFMYTTLGIFGYFRFGDDVKGSITLNLPMDYVPAIAAKVFIILAVFFTYSLHFYVPLDILWKHIGHRVSDKYKGIVQVLSRIFIVCGCGAVAIALPMLEQILAIVGAFFFSILGIIIPSVLETVFYWNLDLGKWNWKLWKNALLLLFGLVALVTGCSVAVSDIVNILHNSD